MTLRTKEYLQFSFFFFCFWVTHLYFAFRLHFYFKVGAPPSKEMYFICFNESHLKVIEDLNALRCVRYGWLAIGTPDIQKLCKYSSLTSMMSHMWTFNIGHSVLLSDKLFSLMWQLLCTQNSWLHAQSIQSIPLQTYLSIVYHKIGLMTFLHQVIVSPSDVRFVTTNLPFLTN